MLKDINNRQLFNTKRKNSPSNSLLFDKEGLFNKVTREEAEVINGGRQIVLKPGYDYPGNDYDVMNTSLEDCRRTCVENETCVGFTYVDDKGSCWLKSKLTRPIPMQGVTSGVIRA